MRIKKNVNKFNLKLVVICGVLILLTNISLAIGQGPAGRKETKTATDFPRLLDSTFYEFNGAIKQITLVQILSPYANSKIDLSKLMGANQAESNSEYVDSFSLNQRYGDRLFIAVTSLANNPREIPRGEVVGMVFGYSHPGLPHENWSGNVVWHPIKKVAYLILARTYQNYATLSIHNLEVDKKIADYPMIFDPQKKASWPTPSKQLSQLKTRLSGDVCGVGKIDVIAESNSLLIYAERQDLHCSANYFRFNLETKEWAEVTLQEKKVK